MTATPTALPPLVTTSAPASFARFTILNRFPGIVSRVAADNDYPARVRHALQALMDEVSSGGDVSPLSASYPEAGWWNKKLAGAAAQNWLGLMWYFAEALFYQRILDAVEYYQPGDLQGKDPFLKQKQAQISADINELAAVYEQFERLAPADEFDLILHSALWGNRIDLCMTGLTANGPTQGESTLAEREFILVDHTAEVRALLAKGVGCVDVINDNTGADSLFDLVLADFLLRQGWARQVRFHLKDRPFFVSDAMPADIEATLAALRNCSAPRVSAMGERLEACLRGGQLELKSDPFWAGGELFEALPDTIRQDLGRADLLIIKGDANYRRLVGERYWPFDTPLETATAYFPFAFLVLRTLKCETTVGVSREDAQMLQALRESDQLAFVSGKYGLIHLRQGQKSAKT